MSVADQRAPSNAAVAGLSDFGPPSLEFGPEPDDASLDNPSPFPAPPAVSIYALQGRQELRIEWLDDEGIYRQTFITLLPFAGTLPTGMPARAEHRPRWSFSPYSWLASILFTSKQTYCDEAEALATIQAAHAE